MDRLDQQMQELAVGEAGLIERADVLVLRYLLEHHPTSAATEAFRQELTVSLTATSDGASSERPQRSLLDIIKDDENRNVRPESSSGTRLQPNGSSSSVPQTSSGWPMLPGDRSLRFGVTTTHSMLHNGNILAVRPCRLPVRRFVTSPADGSDPHFATQLVPCVVSAGADKRVLIFDPASGEVLDSMEPVTRPAEEGHTAAVLDVAQNPAEPREMVTAGMDGKVIVWDLLTRRAHVVLRHHQRFVVKCAWSDDGQFLATAGYDKRVLIYRREATPASLQPSQDDDIDLSPLSSRFTLAQTVETRGNPEAICFVSDQHASPSPNSRPPSVSLAWSMRDDCFLHYVRFPAMHQTQNSDMDTSPDATGEVWEQEKYNTNEHPDDVHISYSILAICQHPTLPILSLVTGSHASQGSCSHVLLVRPFHAGREANIHTTVPTSTSYAPRQAWNQAGTAVWISSEEGRLKMYDLHGRERCDVGVHGAASEMDLTGMSAEEKARRWRMGTMNGLIKDVAYVGDSDAIISCGFDRTVRIIEPVPQPA